RRVRADACGRIGFEVSGELCLQVLEDLKRQLSVLLGQIRVLEDRLQDLDVLTIRLVRLVRRVLERQAVLLRLAVAGEEQNRTRVGSLDREEQIQEDEGLRVEVEEEDRVADH